MPTLSTAAASTKTMDATVMTATTTVAPTTLCPTCATLKSGKRSCCAGGGAWFGTCGDDGDDDSDHTWFEGIQACKDSASSLSSEVQSQFMLHEKSTKKAQVHATQQPTIDSTHGVVTANSQGYGRLTNSVAFTSLLFVTVYIQILN